MKKIFILLFLLVSMTAISQRYTYIGNQYEWLGGLFRKLGVPAGSGPAAFQTGQRQQAGAIYYDSTGVDSGLYVYSGLAWLKLGIGAGYTDAQARAAISLTTTGTSGVATYNNLTGVFNIPNYGNGSTTWNGFFGGSALPTGNTTFTGGSDFVQYVYRGTGTATFTLPNLATNGNRAYFIKNEGTDTLTVQRAGSDQLYTNVAVNSITIPVGESRIILSSGFNWHVHTGGGGGSGSTDTTSLSNRINKAFDSISAVNDTTARFHKPNGGYIDLVINGGGNGGSDPSFSPVASSAFEKKNSYTDKEADNYIISTYGDSATGFYKAPYDTIPIIDRREIVSNGIYYNAFPLLLYSPADHYLYMPIQEGNAHALKSASVIHRSIDGGKTWQRMQPIAEASQTSDYKRPVIGIRVSDNRMYAVVDNGIGNGLGLNPRISTVYFSDDKAASFDTAGTIDATSIYAYRGTTSSGGIFITPAGTRLLPAYGLDANNTSFEAGIIRDTTTSGHWFNQWNYIKFSQDSSVDKFNETKIVRKGDTLFATIRSEGSNAYYYRSWSLVANDGQTWSTPVAINFIGGAAFRSCPNPEVLPDGRFMMITRMAGGKNVGGIYISSDNGLNYYYKGLLYPEEAGFLYSASTVIGDKVLTAYGRAETGFDYTAGNHAGIYLATTPADPSALYYKNEDGITLFRDNNAPSNLSDQFQSWVATESNIIAAPKPISIGTDSTSTAPLKVAGKIEVANGANLVTDIVSKGVRSSTFSNSHLQGAMALSDTLGVIDSFVTGTRMTGGAVDRFGRIWISNGTSSTNIIIYDPITKDTILKPVGATLHNPPVVYGNFVFFVPTSGTTLKIYNSTTLDSMHRTLPGSGWTGGANLAFDAVWSCKRSSSTDILKINAKDFTSQILTAPEATFRNVGVFDGKYQWFTPASATHYLRIDKDGNFSILNNKLQWTGGIGDFKTSIMRGSKMWLAPATGNVVPIIDVVTLRGDTLTLPSGNTYEAVWTDGPRIYFAGKNNNTVVQVDPDTKEIKVNNLPGAVVTSYNVAAVLLNNKSYIIGDQSNKITSFESIELGGDLVGQKVNRSEFLDTVQSLRDSIAAVGGLSGTQMSVTADENGVKLVNDENSPGNDEYYGTNGSGVKGYHPLSGGQVVTLSKGFMFDTLTVSGVKTISRQYTYWDEFVGSASTVAGTAFMQEVASGTAANASTENASASITGATGDQYAVIETGTTTTGSAILGYGGANGHNLGKVDSNKYYRLSLKNVIFNDLSDGTDTYKVWLGFGISSANTNGIFVTYTHSENSGNFVLVTYNNLTAETTNTATAVSADTEYDFDIEFYNNTVKFWINGTLAATHTTQVPAHAGTMQNVMLKNLKSAGTNNREVFIDAAALRITHENDL